MELGTLGTLPSEDYLVAEGLELLNLRHKLL
uniref:Uncharacterized protein n=1 Tax=Arundo donax TaxID=35708 RepID=A0A0A8YEL0_ARUDO